MTRYHHHGFVLVRASTDPGEVCPPRHLDPTDHGDHPELLTWLRHLWQRPEVRDALSTASTPLADAAARLATTTAPVPAGVAQRVLTAVASYMLRWHRRATPFGLFAGITPATIGPASACLGAGHRAIARPDSDWLATLVRRCAAHHAVREQLSLVAHHDTEHRDGRLTLLLRAEIGAREPGAPRWASVRATAPARAALITARRPITFTALTEQLRARFPAAPPDRLRGLLHELIDAGLLLTQLPAPLTVPDPLGHAITTLRRALHALPADDTPEVRAQVEQLDAVHHHLGEHNRATTTTAAREVRAELDTRMRSIAPTAAHCLAIDTHLDARITLPATVLAEAEDAARVLLRTAVFPFGATAWRDYHSRFRTRYGTGALVPVRDLVSDAGLGYPPGYLRAPRQQRSWRALTERDVTLFGWIQRATLHGDDEIALTDTDVEALSTDNPTEVIAPRRVEIGVALEASTVAAIDAGTFRLRVTAAPRPCTTMLGRFSHLLTDTDRARLAATFTDSTSHTAERAELLVQLSFPARRPHNDNITRSLPLLPVLHLGEHPSNPTTDSEPDGAGEIRIEVDDLAVTADTTCFHLVHRPTGRRVTAYVGHALEMTAQSPPLARFLAEISESRSAAYRGFDLGAARTLPWVPRIRYQRTILHPARWLLTPTNLTEHPGTPHDQLRAWARRWRTPNRVVAVAGELRLPLRLDAPLDRALLLGQLRKHGHLELHEGTPDHGHDWIGRPAELLIPLTTTSEPAALPHTTEAADLALPGHTDLLCARITGNPASFDDILTHIPTLITDLGDAVCHWWISRHHNLAHPDTDQHISLHLRLSAPDEYGPAATRLAEFATALTQRGLPGELTLAPAAQHPARYGTGHARAAAETVFGSDSAAAITQLITARHHGTPPQALAAASLAHLAAAFAPDHATGHRALLAAIPQRHGHQDRDLLTHTLHAFTTHATPHTTGTAPTAALCTAVARAWRARATALGLYYSALRTAGRDPDDLLPVLLHDHHVRSLGVDPDTEAATRRLARACALRYLATTR